MLFATLNIGLWGPGDSEKQPTGVFEKWGDISSVNSTKTPPKIEKCLLGLYFFLNQVVNLDNFP